MHCGNIKTSCPTSKQTAVYTVVDLCCFFWEGCLFGSHMLPSKLRLQFPAIPCNSLTAVHCIAHCKYGTASQTLNIGCIGLPRQMALQHVMHVACFCMFAFCTSSPTGLYGLRSRVSKTSPQRRTTFLLSPDIVEVSCLV